MTSEQLEAIAAKLIGQPVYVLLSSDGAEFGGPAIAGLYGRRLDLTARDFLWSANRWNGRRPAVFIDDARARSELEVYSILTHELAHTCDMGFDATPEVEVCAASMSLTRRVHQQTVEAEVEPVEFDELHSSRFVRAAIHLWRRVQATGIWFPPDWLYQPALYRTPAPDAVIGALADEPNRLAQLPVALILTLPAPAAFDNLFVRS